MDSTFFFLSVSERNRRREANRIIKLDIKAVVPYDFYFSSGAECIVMMSSKKKLTYSECRRRGRPYVSFF